MMTHTLGWLEVGTVFADGSHFHDWEMIEESGVWHWQYDTHELTFEIYRHDDQYWKLYRMRWVNPAGGYEYSYGGQACRMALVQYTKKSRSPHSNLAMAEDDREWVRVYEVSPLIHEVVKEGNTV